MNAFIASQRQVTPSRHIGCLRRLSLRHITITIRHVYAAATITIDTEIRDAYYAAITTWR